MKKHFSLFGHLTHRVENAFTQGEWVTVYERNFLQEQTGLVYACLVQAKKMKSYMHSVEWEIIPGSEGRAQMATTEKTGKIQTRYQSFAQKGLEPLIYLRSFLYNEGYEAYTDVSEEFVLYFNLFEKAENKKERNYFFVDALGRLDEVIKVTEEQVQIKLGYLLEYLSVRKMHLVLCFDSMLIRESDAENMENSLTVRDKGFIYHYQAQAVFSGKMQHRIKGKTFIAPGRKKNHIHYVDKGPQKFESFITGMDANGEEILQDCKTGDNKYLVLTWFNKKVLDRYLRDTSRYKVSKYALVSQYFSLKMDNSRPDYVGVYLIELGTLPYREQLHWKKHNVWPVNR